MSEQYEKAIAKIETECESDINNNALVFIGNYLRDKIKDNESYCEMVLDKDKTVVKAYEAMRTEAEKQVKKKSGSVCICLSPDEGLAIVDKYYGFDDTALTQLHMPVSNSPVKNSPQSKKIISLSDLIGE